MKKIVLISFIVFVFGIVPHTFAQGFVPLTPIPGLTQDTTAIINNGNFASFFNNLYKYCIGLAAVLAVIMIIWGGLEISTQDSISKQGAGRERITQAILGLILVLSPVLVFSIINPSILNLSLSIPALNTVSGVKVQTTRDTQLTTTETIDRPQGSTNLFSFEIPDPGGTLTPAEKLGILNTKYQECINYAGGPGIIVPISLQTSLLRFTCQTCSPETTVSVSSCARQNTTFVCGSCR